MPRSAKRLFAVGLLVLMGPICAAAQSENVKTVEGPRGEKTTLTARPHGVADGLSVRALGGTAGDSTRWALSLIGAAPDDDITIRYGGESLPILRVRRPEDGVGPTRVYVSKETFLTMAETAGVALVVGDVTATLPEQLRREMKTIFDRVT